MLCIVELALGEGNRTPYDIGETGLALCVPSGWTHSGETPALMQFTIENGGGILLVQFARFPQWTFEEFETELVKASARNSVTDIEKITLGSRTWLTHCMELETAQS